MEIRLLSVDDEFRFDAFLAKHRDSSMFLRTNARRQGLGEGLRVGAFRDGEMIGVVEHGPSGMLLVQAPDFVSELVHACVRASRRPVTGLSGPRSQVREARAALGAGGADARFQGDDTLYGLDLSNLIIPAALRANAELVRPPLPRESDTLCAWRLAYEIELLGASDSSEIRRRVAGHVDEQIAERSACVAVVADEPVSLSLLTAVLPDMVQLGGIYTPPELRGRGFAKIAVAGSVLAARQRGAVRAVLFTSNPSAMRTYEALGFRPVGDYSLVLLR